ncbi:MAG: glycosyltransferase family 4 protein [Candidatus Krumholzibacteria bacterium]|nr:glycosyltransferase family 4 protein [Candidatus Krumholzibacteria bacterium]
MKNRRFLFIGPLPPPIGGETVSTTKLIGSRYWDDAGVNLTTIDMYKGVRIKLPGEKIDARDLFRAVRIFIQFIFNLPGKDKVLLWITRRALCSLGLAVILVSRMFRKPVIVKVFGSYLVEQILEYGPIYRRFILSVLSRAELILPQTKAIADGLVMDLGFDESLVVRFPNFLLDRSFSGRREPCSFKGKCLFVGHMKEEKGVFDIIEALGSKNDASCDFYGELIPKYRERFLKEIGKHDNIEYCGIIEPSTVIDTIKKYDILLFPTRHIGEGFPAVILEGLAAGVPIITTEWKSIPDIIENEVTGLLIQPESPEQITGAFDRLAADRELYETLSSRGYEFAKTFSEKIVVKDLLIDELLGLNKRNQE